MSKMRLGYTLIELMIAFSIFIMITSFSIVLLNIVSKQSIKLTLDAELLENARVCMDVIIAHVKEAEAVKLTTVAGTNVLAEFVTTVKKGGVIHEYKFTYNKDLPYGNARYHRVDFGGNELASNISDLTMNITDSILLITIVTDGNTGSGLPRLAEPVVLRANIDLRYKEIR